MKTIYLFLLLSVSMTSNLALAGWGAIAYNSYTGTTSESHGYNSYGDAANSALYACGGGCAIMAWENNNCIALATGNGRWGEAHGYDNANDATAAAINQCGWGCEWREWACS